MKNRKEYYQKRWLAEKATGSTKNKNYYNKNKEKILAKKKDYQKEKAAQMSFKTAKRKASQLQATPSWLTKEHFKEIEQFYIDAKELQWLSDPTDPLEVDHIVPLQGKNVSGLHVPWNLQILPRSKNRSKSNTLINM